MGRICILMKTARERFKKFIEDFYLVLVLVFLYAPILVMMVLSFNSSKSRSSGRIHLKMVHTDV